MSTGESSPTSSGQAAGATVWMLRAGRSGVYAGTFVERSLVVVGWGETGDIAAMSHEQLEKAVAEHFPDFTALRRGQAVNTLDHLVHTMADGDLIITPEPVSRTLLFGRVAGPYQYLNAGIDKTYQHARPVTWFARVERDDLSYGARNSLGALLTLSRPGHASELLQIADAHAHDPQPSPLVAPPAKSSTKAIQLKVPIPANAVPLAPLLASEFQTNPMAMMLLVDQLENGQIALPDFQRSFVWAPDATRELIVSVIRSFPAGALLFLQGGNAIFKARPVEAAAPSNLPSSFLVLDGQQRLTSLFQAVTGLGQSRFFLDVGALIGGSEVNDAVKVFNAAQAAPLESLEAQANALMMPLSAVRHGNAGKWRDEVVAMRDKDEQDTLRALLYGVEARFITPLVNYRFPVTVLPPGTELEAVCTIFETLNRTGKPLTPFELISARGFAGGVSLHEYWDSARAEHPVLEDFELEPYYLLQVIALRLGKSAKRGSVLTLEAEEIENAWSAAVADMAAAITLLREECGVLVSKWLPYRPMLIPLATAWRKIAEATGPDPGAMRTKLKQWFWCACFAGEYESSSATLAERDAPVLREWLAGGDAPPVVTEFGWDPYRWRRVTIRQQGLYRATIALILTNRPRDFHTGAPLTKEVMASGKIDDHHVFPRGFLQDIGLGGEIDSVLNHALIDRTTNTSIGKKAPSVYLGAIQKVPGNDLDAVLASQHLPTGAQSPLMTDKFGDFIAWRSDVLSDLLQARVGKFKPLTQPVDPVLAKLDVRIESAELALRELIVARLQNDATQLPSHLRQKARERMDAAARREPGAPATAAADLDGTLAYLDLRDLQATVAGKATWPAFSPVFATKELLESRFAQLTELRNAIRHSRTVSEITIKDGEAALLWFEQAFDGAADAAVSNTS